MDAIGPGESAWSILIAASAPRRRPRFDAAFLLKWLAAFLVAALFVCGTWLMVRRLTGSFATPLAGITLLTVGALAVLWAAFARLLWRHASNAPRRSWQQRTMDWAPTGALVLIATSAVMPGSSLPAVALLWTMVAVEELGASLIGRRPKPVHSSIAVALSPYFRGRITPLPKRKEALEIDDSLPPQVQQRQTRQRAADGLEAIHGTLRAFFATGQRVAIEHLVFCPMLAAVPKVTAVVLDELECSARATHIYRYGARLELKLPEPCDEPLEVVVRYEVHG
jgi:cytochrome b561